MGFDYKTSTQLGKTETPLLEGKTKSCMHQDPPRLLSPSVAREMTPQETDQSYPPVLESLLWRHGSAVAHQGQEQWWQQEQSWNLPLGVSPLAGFRYPTEEPVDPGTGHLRPNN